MATTSPDNIQYPVNSDQVAPLASHFKNLADSTQAALNTKANTAELSTDIEALENLEYVKFDVTYAGGSTQPGMLAWDADNETLQFQLDPHVTLQVGQEHLIRVKNDSGSVDIPNGTVVMFAGATGDTVTVAPAVSDGSVSINYLVGLTTEEIPADGFGFVTQLGFVNGVNTNAYNVGDILYPNPAVPGGLTAVEPEAPNWKVPIAAVTKKNASSGRMLVRAIGGGGGGGASVVVSDSAPEAGANGDMWYDSTDGTLYVYYEDVDGSQWVQVQANSALGASIESRLGALESQAIAYGNPNPNLIINGAFEINQRQFTSTTATGAYGFDRWFFSSANGTVTYSSQAFDAGSGPEQSASNFARVVNSGQTLSSAISIFRQSIEDVRLIAGKTVTVSFWARAASGTPKVALEFSQVFGTGGSPSFVETSYAGQVTLSTSWTRYSLTHTIPSISGKIVGTNPNTSYTTLSLWTSAGADFSARTGSIGIQNNTFDFWGVQLEEGSTATTFRRNANSLQGELAACQRYYQRISAPPSVPGNNTGLVLGFQQTTTGSRFLYYAPVVMRSAPAVSETAMDVSDDWSYATPITALTTFPNNSPQTVYLNVQHTSNGAQSRPVVLRSRFGNLCFVEFSAEL
jgi:hypothetical protein